MTQAVSISLDSAGLLSPILRDYRLGADTLRPFYTLPPVMDSFAQRIGERSVDSATRTLLVDKLIHQHRDYTSSYPKLRQHIEILRSDTSRTVTTGHQLCLAGGPLYFLYKIITTITLAESLSTRFPSNPVVPVFWMASEDHDIEEINHFYAHQQKWTWLSSQRGGSGRLRTDETLHRLVEEWFAKISDLTYAGELKEWMEEAYAGDRTLSEATRALLMRLFGEEGLVVLDADDGDLKRLFLPVMKEDCLEQTSYRICTSTSERLARNYPVQVKPRSINLFYLTDQSRERISGSKAEGFSVLNSSKSWTTEAMLSEMESFPERFSPNVVLRPLYQEWILPNLAYVGGPGELAYWFQYADIFKHFNVPFPILFPRAHGLVIREKSLTRLIEMHLLPDIFTEDILVLHDRYVRLKNTNVPSALAADDELRAIYQRLSEQLAEFDSTLQASVSAELQKARNGLELIEKKISASLRRRNEQSLQQITQLKNELMPDSIPQERYLNFMDRYALLGPDWLRDLKASLIPFSDSLNICVSR